MNVNNWRMFAACAMLVFRRGTRRTTYPLLYFDVWTGDKFFHLLDHALHSALDLFQEVICPLLSSFCSPVRENLICSLNIHGNTFGIQVGDVWMQEVRQKFLRCQQLTVDVFKSENNAMTNATRTRKTLRISMQRPIGSRSNTLVRLHAAKVSHRKEP